VSDPRKVAELEAQVASDKQKYEQIERRGAELVENIPPRGFGAVSTGLEYRGEMEALDDSIRKGEEMLAGERSGYR
jgi:hypothetical protein